MSNERNAFKAGLFIVFSIALIIAIVIGIKGVGRFIEPMQDVTATFKLTDNIGGLSIGDEVRVGGAKVGVVKDIDITRDANNELLITVHFSIPERLEVHKDAKLVVETGLTGVSVLNFSTLGDGPVLAEGDVLAGSPGALTALFDSFADIKNVTLPKVNAGLDSIKGAADTGKETLADAKEQIKPAFDKYHTVADSGKKALDEIGDTFGVTKADFKTTMSNVAKTSESLPGMADKVDGLLTKIHAGMDGALVAMEDLKKMASGLKDSSHSLRSILVSNRGKIDTMIANLKTTSDNLKTAIAEVRRSPWRVLYQPKPGEMANLNLYDSARQFADGAGDLNEAALALRDALKDPDANPEHVQKLVEKLDQTFENFGQVEQTLWKQVQP